MRIKFKDFTGLIESFFRNDTTVPRTYQFPDKDITVAGIVDLNSLQDDIILAGALLGSVIKAQTLGLNFTNISAAASTLNNDRVRFFPVYLKIAATLTGVKWISRIQGNYTASGENRIGLYSYSAGTLTLVAASANNGNLWKATANTMVATPFSATYDAVAGLYFIGEIHNSSANVVTPAIAASTQALGDVAQSTMDLTNSARFSSFIAASALPATQAMSGLTTGTNYLWFALY